MSGQFTDEQKTIIRKWTHELDGIFYNLRFVREELEKEATVRPTVLSVHSKSVRKLESIITKMNEAAPREVLPEVSHG